MDHSHAAAPEYSDDIDSFCTTPYASGAPLNLRYYFSAPSSPTHFLISTAASPPAAAASDASSSFDFDFDISATGPSSADELFCNGRIRPTERSSHSLGPLIESDDAFAEEHRETLPRVRPRAGSPRRRSRSMSPLRSALDEEGKGSDETTSGRRSRRWVFLKAFLYRSKSDGRRNEGHNGNNTKRKTSSGEAADEELGVKKSAINNSNSNSNNRYTGGGKRRGSLPLPSPSPSQSRLRSASAHELHYTAKRAQTEEMRKKTFLPYRQGLLGCLGFSCKGYGAIDGFAAALSSR